MNRSWLGSFSVSLLLALGAISCRDPAAPEEPGPELSRYVLPDVPKDVEHPTFIDFGGKVHLVGYDVEPEGVVSPGSKVKLTLYWRSNSRLGPGWSLFTHLDAPGVPRQNLDKAGPLRKIVSGPNGPRQALAPSLWEPGRVYVDELEFELPKNVDSPEVTVLAGIWREALPQERKAEPGKDEAGKDKASEDKAEVSYPGLRLPVLSGPTDGSERAVVTHIRTGRQWRSPRAAKAANANREKGTPSAAERRQR